MKTRSYYKWTENDASIFANETVCDKVFTECAISLLPFDGIVHITMSISESILSV